MSDLVPVILAAVFIMCASLVGVFFSYGVFAQRLRAHMALLATFSAGVFAVLAYHLTAEAFAEIQSNWLALGAIGVGVLLLEGVQYFVPAHHHHEPADHAHSQLDGRRVLLTDALHNITDGMILVPAFLVDVRLGIVAAVGIFLHELVQEISEFFILRESGYSAKAALARNFLVSASIFIGIAAAYLLAEQATLLSLVIGLAAGSLLSLLVRDLIPHAVHSARANRTSVHHAVAAALGAALMIGVSLAVPETHVEAGNLAESHSAEEASN